jgi:hypothetical protein
VAKDVAVISPLPHKVAERRATIIQGDSKRPLQLSKLIYIYSEDMYSILNCHNVAKHPEFYLE